MSTFLAPARWPRLRAQVAMKVTRTLADHEGAPIRRIVSGGQTASAARPVNIQIDVEG